MLTPQNDEERKALRLAMAMNHFPAEEAGGFVDENWRDSYLRVLAEARAIVRDEQDGKQADFNARVGDAWELSKVREDITRTAAVVASLRPVWQRTVNGEAYQESGDQGEYDKQMMVLCSLLSRERELTAKG